MPGAEGNSRRFDIGRTTIDTKNHSTELLVSRMKIAKIEPRIFGRLLFAGVMIKALI